MTDSSQHDLRIRSTRRHFFRDCGVGVGKIALASLLSQSLSPSSNLYAENAVRPTAPKPPHFKPRAKRVIFLFMAGAPSQLDTFDMKPEAPSEIRGPFKPIDTASPDINISEIFPLHARVAAPIVGLQGFKGFFDHWFDFPDN